MKCPHCDVAIHWKPKRTEVMCYVEDLLEEDENLREVAWEIQSEICPECTEPIMFLLRGTAQYQSSGIGPQTLVDTSAEYGKFMVWPSSANRACPPQVPHSLREDFQEASQVLDISPKASAALSRRCLQQLLTDHARATKKDLANQIQQVIDRNILSSDLAAQLDAVRNIGNFAAHPQKALATGEILPVEPHEAEWNLDVLEELFDHFFVKPVRAKARRDKLNEKLVKAGKPLLC